MATALKPIKDDVGTLKDDVGTLKDDMGNLKDVLNHVRGRTNQMYDALQKHGLPLPLRIHSEVGKYETPTEWLAAIDREGVSTEQRLGSKKS